MALHPFKPSCTHLSSVDCSLLTTHDYNPHYFLKRSGKGGGAFAILPRSIVCQRIH